MTTAELPTTTGKASGNRPFRTLRVAEVSRLCDDAAAITFDRARGCADEFASPQDNRSPSAAPWTVSNSGVRTRSARP